MIRLSPAPGAIRLLAAAAIGFMSLSACTREAAAPGPATTELPKGAGSLTGVWLNTSYKGSSSHPERDRVLHTVDGEFPPLLPWAAELLDKRIKDSEAGLPFASTLALCLPGGIPLMLFGDDVPIQILEAPEQVTMLFMEGNRFRVVPLHAQHPPHIDPSFMGDAVARWDGDTLVIDNLGFKERTTLDQIGMPHTGQLHVTERYRRLDQDSLEVRVTIDDPGAFARPWDAKTVYKRAPAGTRVTEDVCENNRNLPDEQGRSGFQRF